MAGAGYNVLGPWCELLAKEAKQHIRNILLYLDFYSVKQCMHDPKLHT
jgi:hypothetical protein